MIKILRAYYQEYPKDTAARKSVEVLFGYATSLTKCPRIEASVSVSEQLNMIVSAAGKAMKDHFENSALARSIMDSFIF